jgi:hypothetical protein
VNKDGKTDFIASRGHGNGVVWFEAPSWREHAIHATLREPHCLIVLDMDGDGDLDAATCAYGDKQVWWFENESAQVAAAPFSNSRCPVSFSCTVT